MNTKRIAKWGVCIIAVGFLTFFGATWQRKQVKDLKNEFPSEVAPVFFVPGSSAGQNRFNLLFSKLNKDGHVHSVLKVKVGRDGHLTYTGKINKDDPSPFIVVAFQNNHDGYSNIKKQAAWFSIAFDQLQKIYHFNHFSAVGHSNGGVILTLFLEKYLPKHVTINRLMTIASPFNLERRSTKKTQMLKDLIAGRKNLPKKMKVYSIAGTENYSGDGTVPFMSVDSGKYIFQDRVAGYTEVVVTGSGTFHSALPQNPQIVHMIEQYILKANIPSNVQRQNKMLGRIH